MGRFATGCILLCLVLPLAAASGESSLVRFLVSFEDEAPGVGGVLAGARVVESFGFARVAVLEGSLAARAAVAALPGVLGVYEEEPVALMMERERSVVGAEPPAGASWPTGSGVGVAVVDSGIDAGHPAFAGRVSANVRIARGGAISQASGDDDGHGTHVAGIVASDGAGSASSRHRGIAPGASLVGVDISDSFTTTNAVRAFAWISENADRYGIRVVTNSWGREKDDAHFDAEDPVVRASDALVAQGLVVVFSAGNRGRDGASTLTTEASNPNVIAVGAASASGRAESYSSRGPAVDGGGRTLAWTKPDIVAPGTAVVSTRSSAIAATDARTDEERYYTVMNGTSMAAPHVAAAAALLLDLQPDLSPAQVQRLLQRTASDLGSAGADDETGYGMLDVAAALREASASAAGEQRIVVETRQPVRSSGSVLAAAGQVIMVNAAPSLPPEQIVRIPVILAPGTAGLDLWFNWSGAGDFEARLVGPEGGEPFERVGGKSLRLAASATPGAWSVEATPMGVASDTPYLLSGWALVREERVVEVAAERSGRPMGASGAFPLAAGGTRPLDVVAQAPLLALAVLATVAIGGTAVLRARKR